MFIEFYFVDHNYGQIDLQWVKTSLIYYSGNALSRL